MGRTQAHEYKIYKEGGGDLQVIPRIENTK